VLSGSRTSYTMVITTHNRAALLSRLLDYLEAERASFPLLILDSSAAVVQRENANRIAHSRLEVRHLTYSPDLDSYLKVQDGLRVVGTAYCSVCADDDVVFLPALAQCLRVLARQPEVCAAHGTYFNFFEGASFDLSYVVYRGSSILAPGPLARLRQLFTAYEAVYYAVYRTHVLQAAFRRVNELDTVLGRELVTAALTALSGKVVRINDFYYGRSTGESFPYTSAHPHQILSAAPRLLFEDYVRFRTILLDHLGGIPQSLERTQALLDLIFLQYLKPFLRPDVLDLIIADRLKGWDAKATTAHLWDVFVRSERGAHPVEPLTDGGQFNPERFKDGGPHPDYVITMPTRARVPRTYRIFHEFLFPELRPPAVVAKDNVLHVLERLNAY
jgi:glycosyltransferase domain-containing protein